VKAIDGDRRLVIEDYYKIVDDVVLLVSITTVTENDEVVERTCRERVFDASETPAILDLLLMDYKMMSTCTLKDKSVIVCNDMKTNETFEIKIRALAKILPS
jgi:hypothetical protein